MIIIPLGKSLRTIEMRKGETVKIPREMNCATDTGIVLENDTGSNLKIDVDELQDGTRPQLTIHVKNIEPKKEQQQNPLEFYQAD